MIDLLYAAATAISLKELLALGGGIGAIVGAVWFLSRRFTRVEVAVGQLAERQTASTAVQARQSEAIDGLEAKIDSFYRALVDLREEVQILRLEKDTLGKELERHEKIHHSDTPRPRG